MHKRFENIYDWLFSRDSIQKIDWKVFLICMVLAGLIWLLNSLGNIHTTELSYKVVFKDETTHKLNLANTNPTIKFTIKGKGWNILQEEYYQNRKGVLYHIINKKLRDNHILATDLKASLKNTLVKGLTIQEIRQDTFTVDIDQNISKFVPVIINRDQISLKNNCFIDGDIDIVPSKINLLGTLKDLHHIDTLVLSITDKNISKDYNKVYEIKKMLFGKINAIPQNVRVFFKVKKYITKIVEVPIQKVNFSYQSKFFISAQKAEIVYTCQSQDKDKINASDFQVVADYNHTNMADSTLELSLEHVPTNIINANINNQRIKLNLK